MSLIALARGPRQRIPGAVLYDVDRSLGEPLRDVDFVAIDGTAHEMLFATGTQLERAYHVETVRHWDDEVKPGLTRLAFVAPLPGVDPTTFRARYEGHAAIARVQHPAICRYVQHFVRRGTEPLCAAVTELHFANEDEMRRRFYLDDNSASIVAADIEDYLDRERTWSLLTRSRL
ncbi:MAG: hypothetical protein QOG53_1191 [Frankiales bacterium]|nr:hypothetical protein [Frankiales bacterium]